MFKNCSSLTTLNLSGFNASSVGNNKRIYFDCEQKIKRNLVKMYHPIEDKINPIFNDLKSKEEDLGIKVKSFQSAFIPIMLNDE